MGEIAEMMLDGTLCAGCGEAMIFGPEDETAGYPVYCGGCQIDDTGEPEVAAAPPSKPRVACPVCGRRVKEIGLSQHMRDKHGPPKCPAPSSP